MSAPQPMPSDREREPDGSPESVIEPQFESISQNNSEATNDVDPNRP